MMRKGLPFRRNSLPWTVKVPEVAVGCCAEVLPSTISRNGKRKTASRVERMGSVCQLLGKWHKFRHGWREIRLALAAGRTRGAGKMRGVQRGAAEGFRICPRAR